MRDVCSVTGKVVFELERKKSGGGDETNRTIEKQQYIIMRHSRLNKCMTFGTKFSALLQYTNI